LSPETKSRAKALLCLDELGDKPLSLAGTTRKCKLHRETVYGIRKQFVSESLEAVVYCKKRETPPAEAKVTGDIESSHYCSCLLIYPRGQKQMDFADDSG